jgi:protein-S-isoprenylcysteine O-methyltransferase Ste14
MRRETGDNVLMGITGVAFFLNVLFLNILDIVLISEELFVVGWIILAIGALLVVLSVLTLKRKGTTNATDTGVYGIVRHPMYTGGLVMFISHIFFGQNWIIAVNTIIGIVCCYLIMQSEEQKLIQKFGDEYTRYMQKVPRMNLFLGIIRLLQRRKKE